MICLVNATYNSTPGGIHECQTIPCLLGAGAFVESQLHTVLAFYRSPCRRGCRERVNEVVHIVLWDTVDVDAIPIPVHEKHDVACVKI